MTLHLHLAVLAVGFLAISQSPCAETVPSSKDLTSTVAAAMQACDGGDAGSCTKLGISYVLGEGGLPKDPARSVVLFKQACDGGHAGGCAFLGSAYANGNGGLQENPPRAAALFRQACDGGDALGCRNLGIDYANGNGGLPKDPTRAAALFKQACDSGDATGCFYLGIYYKDGTGGLPKDPTRAVALYKQACDGGDADSCNSLGFSYANGISGLPKDPTRAAALFKQACDGGTALGCENLERVASQGTQLASAAGTAPPGKADLPRQLELFGTKIKGANRAQLRDAFARGGLKPLRVDDNYWVDKYSAQGVLEGASAFEAGYVSKSNVFAYAKYQFDGSMDTGLVTKVANLVTNKYGRPTSQSGRENLGPVTYRWNMPQGTYIEVSRGWPDTTTYLSFVDQASFAAMNAEIEAQKQADEKSKAKEQSNAF